MTKDASGRSSAAGSARGPSPFKNEDSNEVSELEAQQSSEAPLNLPPKTSSPDDSDRPIDANAPDSGAAVSQPMTASNSNSSNPSMKDIGMGSAAPYGTRSRNRTGTSRPNYAEDKELDTEFEVTSTVKDNLGRKARATDTSASEAGKPANSSRKGGAPEGDQLATVQIHYKDPIPGTSTFSANPITAAAPTQSKKRKAAAQSTTYQSQQGSSQPTLPVQTVTRRASMAAQVAAGFRETNMLTFENCAGRLKGKKLVADDGTILEVNGMQNLQCSHFLYPFEGCLRLIVL
jgi:hypothetical protein